MSGPLLELGRRAAARLPADAEPLARMHLFDALAAGLAGAATGEGRRAARHVAAVTGAGRSPAAADVVLALARRIRATELDDLQLESVTTAAAAVVPALIGAQAAAGSGGRHGDADADADALPGAIAAGYDVMFTLGLAAGGPDFLYRQGGWPSLAGAGPAAAAATARLLGLGAEGIAHAIALALRSTPRTVQGSGEDGRWLSFGLATAAGFHAGLAAATGARGDLGLLDAGRPLAAAAGAGGGLFAGIGAALDRPWTPGSGLAGAHFKRWASAGQVAAAVDALGTLIEAHGFAAARVTAIDVAVPPAYRRMIDQPTGTGRLWSLLSAQYQLAARLCHPADLYDCTRSFLRDSPGFRRVMGVIRVRDAGDLAVRHPRSYPARVVVTLTDGAVVECLSDGRSPSPTWDWDTVLGKARSVAAGTGTEPAVSRLLEAAPRSSNSHDLLSVALPLFLDDG